MYNKRKTTKQIYDRELCGSTDAILDEWHSMTKQAIETHIRELYDELDALSNAAQTEIAEKEYELRFFVAYLDLFFS